MMEIPPELWVPITSMIAAAGGAVGRALQSRRVKELEQDAELREVYWQGREDKQQSRIKHLEASQDSLEARLDECVRQRSERDAIREDCVHVHECPWRTRQGGAKDAQGQES